MTKRYQAHSLLVDTARARAQLWRLLLSALTMAVLVVLGFLAISQTLGDNGLRQAVDALVPGEVLPRQTVATLVMLGSFGLVLVATLMAVGLWHRRGLRALLGPLRLMLWQALLTALGIGALAAVVALLPIGGDAQDLRPGLPMELWARLLPIALVLLLVQVTTEEIVFRGWLQPQLAARFSSPLIWLGVPAVIFTLLHIDPSAGVTSVLIILGMIFLYALALGDITARAGTLGPAITMHFFNNFGVLLIASPVGPLDGLALYLRDFALADSAALLAAMPLQIGVTLAAWVIARLVLRR